MLEWINGLMVLKFLNRNLKLDESIMIWVNFSSFDKEFSPFDYYLNGGYINDCKRICVCTNQEFVSNNEICDLCGGFIVGN